MKSPTETIRDCEMIELQTQHTQEIYDMFEDILWFKVATIDEDLANRLVISDFDSYLWCSLYNELDALEQYFDKKEIQWLKSQKSLSETIYN
jgi:hypothetical protein